MRSAMSKMITKRGADSNSNCQEVDTKTDTKTVEMSVICLEPVWKLRGVLFSGKRPDGATKENIPGGSSTEEQRSQMAFSPKTLRAAGLLSVAGVDSFLTARCGALRAAKAALATAKIPRRSAPRSFQIGSHISASAF